MIPGRAARRVLLAALVPALALGVSARAGAAPGSQNRPAGSGADRLARTLPLSAHTPIHVAITEGAVIVSGEPRADVAIEIVRRAGQGKRTADLPMTIDQAADGIHVTALQAGGRRDPDLQAIVTIHAPADADLASIEVFEGQIQLTNLRGAVTAEILRGPIEASGLSGQVRLTDHVGDVTVKRAELSADGLLRLRTFNGLVRLELARRPANARILAVTFNGQISSTLPLEMKTAFGPHFGEATLGAGEPLISIDVVTGNIEITG